MSMMSVSTASIPAALAKYSDWRSVVVLSSSTALAVVVVVVVEVRALFTIVCRLQPLTYTHARTPTDTV